MLLASDPRFPALVTLTLRSPDRSQPTQHLGCERFSATQHVSLVLGVRQPTSQPGKRLRVVFPLAFDGNEPHRSLELITSVFHERRDLRFVAFEVRRDHVPSAPDGTVFRGAVQHSLRIRGERGHGDLVWEQAEVIVRAKPLLYRCATKCGVSNRSEGNLEVSHRAWRFCR
ncbi:MAG: hypothetical protein C0467_21045 [Planctomycetaceae bacterium]|nr:hypothetical protein [Planctomycetaceae bacterium]